MTIKELEMATGMERANIRFYEKEGFLSPARKSNGYRDYSAEDMDLLQKIRLLRSLDISLEEIKALQDGEELLGNTLTKKIRELGQEEQLLEAMQKVCHQMKEEQESFSGLKAEKYLKLLEQIAKEHGKESIEELPPPPRIHYAPYRRVLARMLDVLIAETLLLRPMLQISKVAGSEDAGTALLIVIFLGVMTVLLQMATEPYLLHVFGTTPGKVIFRIRIKTVEGRNLTVKEAKKRLAEMRSTCLDLMLSSALEYAEFRAFFRAPTSDLPWEERNHAYTIEELTVPRALLFIGIAIALLVANQYMLYVATMVRHY